MLTKLYSGEVPLAACQDAALELWPAKTWAEVLDDVGALMYLAVAMRLAVTSGWLGADKEEIWWLEEQRVPLRFNGPFRSLKLDVYYDLCDSYAVPKLTVEQVTGDTMKIANLEAVVLRLATHLADHARQSSPGVEPTDCNVWDRLRREVHAVGTRNVMYLGRLCRGLSTHQSFRIRCGSETLFVGNDGVGNPIEIFHPDHREL